MIKKKKQTLGIEDQIYDLTSFFIFLKSNPWLDWLIYCSTAEKITQGLCKLSMTGKSSNMGQKTKCQRMN